MIKSLFAVSFIATFLLGHTETLASDPIAGYKKARWGYSFKKVSSLFEKGTDVCVTFQYRHIKAASRILSEQSGILKYPFDADALNFEATDASPYLKHFSVKQVEDGCALFYKDRFIAFSNVLQNVSSEKLLKILSEKYGPKRELEKDAFIFEGAKGKIFVFPYSFKPSESFILIFYVSKDLAFLSADLENYDSNYRTQKEQERVKTQKEREIDSMLREL